MKLLIRAAILGFISITLISFFFGSQVSQQASIASYQKEVETIRNEQEQRSCNQFITAKFCTAPRDRYERYLCSERLSQFHCSKYVDVGYLILEEHQNQAGAKQQ